MKKLSFVFAAVALISGTVANAAPLVLAPADFMQHFNGLGITGVAFTANRNTVLSSFRTGTTGVRITTQNSDLIHVESDTFRLIDSTGNLLFSKTIDAYPTTLTENGSKTTTGLN